MGATLACLEPQVADHVEIEHKASVHNDGTSSVATGKDVGNMADLVHSPRREHKVAFEGFWGVRDTLPAHGFETHGALVAEQQLFLGLEARRSAGNSQPANGRLTLHLLSECITPLFFEFVEYLAASPRDCVPLCCIVSHSFSVLGRHIHNALWSMMYMQRWPAFHECMRFYGTTSWKPLYQDTMLGKVTCALEIYHREKKMGFTMSCMPALVHYEKKQDAYLVKYVSASDVPVERIPAKEDRRLRFVPSSARRLLQPESDASHPSTRPPPKPTRSSTAARVAAATHSLRRPSMATATQAQQHAAPTSITSAANPSYSYRPITGVDEGLQIGGGLELQWKMQSGSPFGWWYGELEGLEHRSGASIAKATIIFKHFPPNSRWYRMQVVFGDGEIRDSSFGGQTGGIRSTPLALQQQWYGFLPKDTLA
mmetsp:Transcript_853/g.1550  ORF Transcript_853/g.1550 Transcript_853/m.1550 type:complete len:426 (+) Transcript_853:73-1350(+)